MLYRAIIAVCSQIHTKHINTVCGQNVELLNAKLAERIVTTGLWRAQKVLDPIRKDIHCTINRRSYIVGSMAVGKTKTKGLCEIEDL